MQVALLDLDPFRAQGPEDKARDVDALLGGGLHPELHGDIGRQVERGALHRAVTAVADTEIHHRVAYSEALEYGVAPTIFEPRGEAAREIAELAGEIEALFTEKKPRVRKAG